MKETMQELHSTGREAEFSGAGRDNALIAAANPLLNAIPQIRHSVSHPDPAGLRQRLIEQIQHFEVQSQQAGLSYETIIGARYCLCTALDEAAALTPWGGNSVWPSSGLLVTFHNETWGGEKFFQLLAKLSQKPREHLLLLELIYFCLMLGFEGRYRVLDNGRSQLETIRQRLLQMINSARGAYAQPLSPHPYDQPTQKALWRPVIPLWTWAAVMGFTACLLYIGLNWRLGAATTPVMAAVYQSPIPQVTIQDPAPQAPAMLDLKGFLRPEIQQGLVSVRDEADQSVVILKGDGLFPSASTTIRGNYQPVIQRIAKAMDGVSGKIVVAGYSDNLPIRSARFASNYELSLERAQSVQKLLQQYLREPTRVTAEGRGDSNPIAPNNSAANRARNRRVEITLLVAPATTQAQLNGLRQGN